MKTLTLIAFLLCLAVCAHGQANIIVSDSFIGTTGTLATAHYPTPIGDGYTIHPASASQVSPVLDNANRLMSNDGSPVTIIGKETMPTADYEVSADITLVANIGNLTQGLGLRYDPVANTGYVAFWLFDGNIYLVKNIAGSSTTLQTVPTAVALTTHNIKISAVGTTITMSIDGVPQAPVVDSGISAAGRPALILRESCTDTTGAHTDNFLVTNLGVTAVTIVSQTPPAQGTASSAYSRTLASAGGTGAHTWTLDTGTLPTGLTISTGGTLSGTPSVAGLYVFTLKVTDGVAATTTKNFHMGVDGSAVWYVPAGAALQSFLGAAARGDTIHVDNTGTYEGGFALSAKSGSCTASSTTWIDVRSTALASLPAIITAANFAASAPNMPTLKTLDNAGGTGALIASPTACGWKFSGFQITNDTTITINELLTLSSADRISLDRVALYAKGTFAVRTAPYNTTGRIAIQSAGPNLSVTNSYMPGWWGLPPGGTAGATAHDSTCLTYEGVGPVTWTRNFCEAWFNGIQYGGAEQGAVNPAVVQAAPAPTLTTARLSHVTGLVIGMPFYIDVTPWSAAYCKNDNTHPCRGNGIITNIAGNDITYTALIGFDNSGGGTRVTIPGTAAPLVGGGSGWTGAVISGVDVLQNTFTHPFDFSVWQKANNGNTPKSWVEVKQCNNCRFEGNRCGGYWSTMGFNGHNQAGGQPWSTIANYTIKNNWFDMYKAGIFMSLIDAYYYTTNGSNIEISNNLFTSPDEAGAQTGTIPVLFQSGKGGSSGIIFEHNTQIVVSGSQTIGPWQKTGTEYSPTAPTGTIFRNNLLGYGDLGINCFDGALSLCWPGLVEDQNLFVLNNPVPTTPVASQFPNSITAAAWGAVVFVGTCDKDNLVTKCALQAGSPGKGTATDGSDIGVNIGTLISNCPDCMGAAVSNPRILGRTVVLGRTVH